MHLFLQTYGCSLQLEDGRFVVYAQNEKTYVPPGKVKSISLGKGARISSDAVLLAIEHEIDLLFTDGTGMPQGRVWSIKYGSISTIRKNQLEFIFSSSAVEWVKAQLAYKMENQLALLFTLDPAQLKAKNVIKRAINALEDHKQKLLQIKGSLVADIAPSIRGWEGAASRRYFEALSVSLPVLYQFERRSKKPAEDKFNALLNYGYGMLYGKVEGALIRAGLDPYVGVFHRDDYNRPVLVYDVIERFRIWVDYVVFQLCQEDVFPEECFVKRNGGIWLEGLGKRILIQSVNDYLAEVVRLNDQDRSRKHHIQIYCHQLASYFQKK